MNATFTDLESSSSKSNDDVDKDGNYTTFMAISSVDATSHLKEINEKDGDELEANPNEDEIVPETKFSHYQFSDNEGEDDKEELFVLQ